MKVLDLFSGIGGFSLGLERTGAFETVAFCEIDQFCRQVLRKHWPEVPILGDIADAEFPAADVITGGFPCQDISIANSNRPGLSGSRSGLWRQMVRAIRMARPKYAIVENVAALLANGMGNILGDLAEAGYDAEWDCIPAGFIGAPHWRDRVWIVAYTDGAGLEGWSPTAEARTTQRKLADHSFRCGTSWPNAPSIPRVGYGLSDWMDRVRCLGNSVVPQIPEIIGRAICRASSVRI